MLRKLSLSLIVALDQQTTDLRDQLEENQDATRSALDKQRRAEQLAAELQAEVIKEADMNIELEKTKCALEKQIKELNNLIMDLETNAMSDNKGQQKRLEARVEELTQNLDKEINEKAEGVKAFRKTERIIRELQFQLAERDKQKVRQDEESGKNDEVMKRMKIQIEELEYAEGTLQLAKRRAERDAAEIKDKCQRLEKENEKFRLHKYLV